MFLKKLIEKQKNIAQRVVLKPIEESNIELIAGVDVTYFEDYALGVVVLLDKNLKLQEIIYSKDKPSYPYIPGFLAFRELPVVLKCFEILQNRNLLPQIAIFDGHGIAHPKRAGLASHAGVVLGIPTIGVAKKLLYGQCNIPKELGQYSPITDNNGNILGYAYLSKKHSNPIYISPGHLTDPDSALDFVRKLITSYKLPEPTRLAHFYTQKLKLGQ